MSDNALGDIREKLGKLVGLQEAGNLSASHRFNDLEHRIMEMRSEMNSRLDRLHKRQDDADERHGSLERRFDRQSWTAAGIGAGAGIGGGYLSKFFGALFGIFR